MKPMSRRHFKGALRAHDEACVLGVIDTRICSLVAALNVDGVVSSVSSCQGHRVPMLPARRTAFVMFRSAPALAAHLSAKIRADQVSESKLHYYWFVSADFNADGALQFTLQCPQTWFKRRRLDRDFATLTAWIQTQISSLLPQLDSGR